VDRNRGPRTGSWQHRTSPSFRTLRSSDPARWSRGGPGM